MTHTELYNQAAALIAKGWTQGVYSRDKEGNSCDPGEKSAVSWCLSGALLLASDLSAFSSGLREVRSYLGLKVAVATWNDNPGRTQRDVVKLLKNAARRAARGDKTIGEQHEI